MDSTKLLPWFARPAARLWRMPANGDAATRFHRSLPGYAPTALVEIPALATELGVGRLFVKQESERFSLPAFKALGASWAIASELADRNGLDELSPEALRRSAAEDDAPLVAATDGNHGRAVAHFARLFDRESIIVVPSFMTERAQEPIRGEGARLIEVDGSYDEAVETAAKVAAEYDGLLIQDTAWPGYESVPARIVEGYRTMTREIAQQLDKHGLPEPGLVAVPVGVGSLAQAVIAHHRSRGANTSILSCEPDTADCVRASLAAGEPVTVRTATTVMAGLNCGTVSSLAWPLLRDGCDAAVAVDDDAAIAAVRDLAEQGISVGATGSASLAGVRAALTGPGSEERRAQLDVDEHSVVVLLATEGCAGAGGLDLGHTG